MQQPIIRLLATLSLLTAAAAAAAPQEKAASFRKLWNALQLQPGKWHTRATFDAVDITSSDRARPITPAERAKARAQVGKVVETDDCVTGPQSAAGELVLPGIRSSCPVVLGAVSGSKVAFALQCPAELAANARFTLTHAPTRLGGSTVATIDMGGRHIVTRMTFRSTRTGACTG